MKSLFMERPISKEEKREFLNLSEKIDSIQTERITFVTEF